MPAGRDQYAAVRDGLPRTIVPGVLASKLSSLPPRPSATCSTACSRPRTTTMTAGRPWPRVSRRARRDIRPGQADAFAGSTSRFPLAGQLLYALARSSSQTRWWIRHVVRHIDHPPRRRGPGHGTGRVSAPSSARPSGPGPRQYRQGRPPLVTVLEATPGRPCRLPAGPVVLLDGWRGSTSRSCACSSRGWRPAPSSWPTHRPGGPDGRLPVHVRDPARGYVSSLPESDGLESAAAPAAPGQHPAAPYRPVGLAAVASALSSRPPPPSSPAVRSLLCTPSIPLDIPIMLGIVSSRSQ